jgi:FtsH-binding integral membrane protein
LFEHHGGTARSGHVPRGHRLLALGSVLGRSLFAVALLLGLGLGPVMSHYASADPTAVTEAGGATTLIVAAMGTAGLAIAKDVSTWLRPLSVIIFGVGSGGSPLLSLAIAGLPLAAEPLRSGLT